MSQDYVYNITREHDREKICKNLWCLIEFAVNSHNLRIGHTYDPTKRS